LKCQYLQIFVFISLYFETKCDKKTLKSFLHFSPEVQASLERTVQDLHSYKLYIKTDYKLHISTAEQCSDHCIMFALSDPKDSMLQKICNHTHNMVCDRCQLFSRSIIDLKRITSEAKGMHMAFMTCISSLAEYFCHRNFLYM
jgi:hypothetical protein